MKPSFEMNKNMTIKSRTQFNRKIKFEDKEFNSILEDVSNLFD